MTMNRSDDAHDPAEADTFFSPGADAMRDQLLREALSEIAAEAVPATTNLWPGINARLADRTRPARPVRYQRRFAFAAVAALVAVVGWTLVQLALPGQISTAQAADIVRHDPQVAAILRGDIAIVTVTSVVDEVATVVVKDSRGQEVTATVDLRSRIVTSVYQGPQLSADLTARALAVVRTDPRTSALLARGATLGRIMPMIVTYESTDPTTGKPTQGTQTWAQVPLELNGQEWLAYVDLPLSRIDQLIDPQGNQVLQP
jgi:hypothetical protein